MRRSPFLNRRRPSSEFLTSPNNAAPHATYRRCGVTRGSTRSRFASAFQADSLSPNPVVLSRAPNPDPSVTLNPNQESAERDSRAENTDAARDFFGDSNVREAAPPPTPTVQSESGEK